MIAQNFHYKNGQFTTEKPISSFDLLLCFGAKKLIENESITDEIQSNFHSKNIVFCTTAGEIFNSSVQDDTIAITGLKFERTELKTNCVNIQDFKNSHEVGTVLVEGLIKKDLKYVMILADGALVNGSELVDGMRSVLPENVLITGGLAGDGTEFSSTLVGLNKPPMEGVVAAVGFYGDSIRVGHGSLGGWDPFGLERTVTKATANVLEEIDGKKALDLYKRYLGEYADNLPSSALLFPLSMRLKDTETELVRTILNVDHEQQSMTFAGNIPVGSKVRFMKANFDKLIDAAGIAAQDTLAPFSSQKPKYAMLISCVGRKLVLNERTEEEVEAVRDIFGEECKISGFYSYGEITPMNQSIDCQLHNQTMTITTFNEILD